MAVIVKLTNTDKKRNSTKVITAFSLTTEAVLKQPTSVTDPTLLIEADETIVNYNYLYIQQFHRYYYIDDIVSVNHNLWEIRASVDALASFRSDIGIQRLYVLRSSERSDGRIIDTKFPAVTEAHTYIDNIGTFTVSSQATQMTYTDAEIFDKNVEDGYFYLGIYGPNSTGITWYYLLYSGFLTLAQALYNYTPSNFGDLPTGVAKELADPMQYIASIYWLPVRPPGVSPHDISITFGNYVISGIRAKQINPTTEMIKASTTLNIRKHPDASSRGVYLNSAPYTDYKLNLQPWGLLDLDTSLMINDSSLTINFTVDITTGMSELSVYATNSVLVKSITQLGVPINLSQALVDLHGMLSGAVGVVGGGLGIIGSLLTGNVAGTISGAANAIGGYLTATEAKQPTISTKGAGGSFLAFGSTEPQALYSNFYTIVPGFNEELGRPLCQVFTPAQLGGYIMANPQRLSISGATSSEVSDIENIISSGFFYE